MTRVRSETEAAYQADAPTPLAAPESTERLAILGDAPDDVPTERLARLGAGALRVDELLGILGAHGRTDPVARLGRLTAAELRALGIPRRAAERVCSAFELGRRVAQSAAPANTPLRSASAAYRFLQPRIGHLPNEVFVVLLLDIRLRVLREVTVATGTGWACAVHPRDALAPALREGAAAVIFAHNHPSGDPTPSEEDRELTRRLIDASDVLGVRAIDHIVVGGDGFASFRELGLWVQS